jgi:hypothetical protein
MSSKISNVKILINNFSKKYKQYEKNFSKDKILFFKNINEIIFVIIDFCIKENIINIKNIYDTYPDFVSIFKEELVHFLFSNIDIDDPIYTDNVILFTNKNNENNSYYKDYEINMNDYGTLNTHNTYQSHNSQCSTKFKEECDKISLYIYVSSKQNKFENFINKLENMVNEYITA